MKNGIAFLIALMIFFSPAFKLDSFASVEFDGSNLNVNDAYIDLSGYHYTFSSSSSVFVVFCHLETSSGTIPDLCIYSNSLSTVSQFRNGSSRGTLYCSSSYGGIYYNMAHVNYAPSSENTNIPFVNMTKTEFLDYVIANGGVPGVIPPSDPSDLGYLTDVKYFVDSAAYQFNPSDTPEWISWGDISTTGLDLSGSRYNVEFALEDNSSYYMNRLSDYVSEYGFNPIGNVASWIMEARDYVTSLIAPEGSNARALLQGKSVNTAFNGKMISAGSTTASSKQYKFSALSRYLNGLSATISADNLGESSDEWAFRNFLQGYSDNPSNGMMGHMAQNISQLGRLYSMSYNIYARIVDTQTGVSGNWLKIDRHNVPYWDGAEEDVLNGRITAETGYNFTTVNNFGDTFITPGAPSPDVQPQPIDLPIGYDGTVIYNNYTYNYTNYVNPSDSADFGDLLGIFRNFGGIWDIYLFLFGGLMPGWASLAVGAFVPLFLSLGVFRIIKRVIS